MFPPFGGTLEHDPEKWEPVLSRRREVARIDEPGHVERLIVGHGSRALQRGEDAPQAGLEGGEAVGHQLEGIGDSASMLAMAICATPVRITSLIFSALSKLSNRAA